MASGSSSTSGGRILKRAKPSTIQDKFLVGYQGWFTCAGDGEPVGPGHHGWLHWFNYPIPDGGRPNTDFWPDVSAYSPSELFPAPGLKTKAGEQLFLFSSRNAKSVQRHFHWMAEHGVDGAFLQRFAGQCDMENGNEGVRRIRDEVGDLVREAAEREGRVFAIMYDVSGVPADRIQRVLQHDWNHLVRNRGVLDSPNYLKERGKPVINLWGFGFDNAGHTPALVRSIIQFFRDSTPGGVYIMGGAPSCWRLSEGDADRAPEFVDVWLNDFDAISPWTIGRFKTELEADAFAEHKMKGDVELIKKRNEETGRKVDYIPVVLPGGSGYNLSEGKWGLNDIKRNGGRFLWKQISNAKRLGVRTMYGAMWDEYDEGTAFMPIVEHKRNLPHSDKFPFLALDEDGYDVPSDWYMRICGFAAEGLRSERRIHETFPVKELQDYWSSRPRYEELSAKSGDFVSGSSSSSFGASASGSGSGAKDDGQTYAEWLAAQKDDKEEVPPPPYSLEADEEEEAAAATTPSSPASVPASVTPAASTSAQPASVPTTQIPPIIPTAAQSAAPYIHQNPPAVDANVHPPLGAPPMGALGPRPSAQNFQYQQQQHAPVSSLANDFGRQSISGPSGVADIGGRFPISSPPPLHPASRPHSQGRPSSQGRPQSQQGYPPISSAMHTPTSGPAAASTSTTSAPPVWPPPEWGVRPDMNANVTHTTNQSAYPQGHDQPTAPNVGGANLTRPHTITASSYSGGGGGGASLRPSASLAVHGHGPLPRPGSSLSNTSTPGSAAGYPPSTMSEPSSSTYPGYSPTGFGGAPYTQVANSSYKPTPGSSSYTPAAGPSTYNPSTGPASYTPSASPYAPSPTVGGPPPLHGHGHGHIQSHGGPSFPGGPMPSTYTPSGSTYPGQTGSTYPSSYSPPPIHSPTHGSGYSWSAGSAHVSPPQSPPAGAFPTPSQAPYNPAYMTSGGPSFPPNPSSLSSSPNHETGPMGGGGSQYSYSTGGGGYFGGGGSSMPAPDGSTSMYPGSSAASSYPGQYDTPTSTYPGHGGPVYAQASPWVMPGGPPGSSGPPPMPPRPQSSGYGRPPTGPTFPMASSAGSSAFNYALTAVDKVAGRKTKEQIESLAHSGSKLYSKFMK